MSRSKGLDEPCLTSGAQAVPVGKGSRSSAASTVPARGAQSVSCGTAMQPVTLSHFSPRIQGFRHERQAGRRLSGAHSQRAGFDVAEETPLDFAPNLSARIHNSIYFKREDMQPVFSFKIRGAYNKMAKLSPQAPQAWRDLRLGRQPRPGVALSAKYLGVRAVIVMPTTTPQIKIDAVQSRGGEVVLAGESYSDAYAHAVELEKAEKLTFVHPYDDPDVIAGQGTIAMEILRQHPKPLHAVFCCVGGGGLLAGVAAYIKRVRPDVRIIGVGRSMPAP